MIKMLWLIFAIIGAIALGLVGILHRFIVREHDYISYGFLWGILTALFFVPLLFFDFTLPSAPSGWLIAIIGVFIWTIVTIIGFKSVQMIETSFREPITQISLLFVLILSYALLSETLTSAKIIGTLLIFGGLMFLTYEKGKTFGKFGHKGIQLTLVASFMAALASVVDKAALNYWNPIPYAFVEFLFPSLIIGFLVIKRKEHLLRMIKSKHYFIVFASILAVIEVYALYTAYKLTDVSNIYPIGRISSLITVLGGIIILRERKDILRKIIGAIIMIIGAIFISGYFVI